MITWRTPIIQVPSPEDATTLRRNEAPDRHLYTATRDGIEYRIEVGAAGEVLYDETMSAAVGTPWESAVKEWAGRGYFVEVIA